MSGRRTALVRGVSALVWMRVSAGVFVFFLAGLAFTAVVFIGPWGSEFTYPDHPVAATMAMVPMWVGIVLLLSVVFPVVRRDSTERMHGYTTLPFAHQPYDLVDRRTGEVIRRAGVAPLRSFVTLSVKAERARAAASTGPSASGPGEGV